MKIYSWKEIKGMSDEYGDSFTHAKKQIPQHRLNRILDIFWEYNKLAEEANKNYDSNN